MSVYAEKSPIRKTVEAMKARDIVEHFRLAKRLPAWVEIGFKGGRIAVSGEGLFILGHGVKQPSTTLFLCQIVRLNQWLVYRDGYFYSYAAEIFAIEYEEVK